ncbi:ASCH domain-containing protein [Acinetobacter ursingii]|uniref:ASCH domain-containing protein n=1 Tax=Acinetobacter TaxID=469 RepID=UPI001C4C49E0|nr:MULTISPECIES: ASCH domain-containing protein [Acinetobacter]MCU4357765.1 ASCH domain-containing protein [Acinetobacter ursingii]MDA3580622.1 ASCH domain-containing protein [Acinetobacter ursingii]MDH0809118.1 ASCH domain-containing protein [Acinetobacter ursingii]MDH2076339.1 ASCH domain-containing protein [Acinetobacter ursingii]
MKKLKALSIVAPACERIISGQKKLEIRSWRPEHLPLRDLVIVQNTQFLHKDGDEQIGTAMAIIDIVAVHAWRKDEIEMACANYWKEGYWAWEITNVRPLVPGIQCMAKRRIYEIDLAI